MDDPSPVIISRREVIGGIAAFPWLAGLGDGALAAEQKQFKIYGVYTGTDMKSYICELQVADVSAMVPVYQVGALGGPGLPVDGSWQDYHLSTVFGSMTTIIAGQAELGVTAGAVRSVLAGPGDTYLMIDTRGDGHSFMRKGTVPVQIVNARFATTANGLWTTLKQGFKGWPDNVLPPIEYAPFPSTGPGDPSRRFPKKS